MQLYVSGEKSFLVDSHRKTSQLQKTSGSRSDQLIPHTSRTFKKKAVIPILRKRCPRHFYLLTLYKLNKKLIKNLFCVNGLGLPSETACRRTVLQLSADGLRRIRNANHDKFFRLLTRALCLAQRI